MSDDERDPEVGELWIDALGTIRIMAIVEGYVVARRKGAYPFVQSMRIFTREFRREREDEDGL